MAQFGYTRREVALDGTSANSSTYTSNPIWVGDAASIVASYATGANVVSVCSVDASLSDGYSAALGSGAAASVDWSRYSSIATNAYTPLNPGIRWVRFIRSATDSQASVVVSCRVT